MTTRTAWERANNGAIQPPLSPEEINAFALYEVTPGTLIRFESKTRTFEDTALNALIECVHIRLPRKPDIAARELLRNRI